MAQVHVNNITVGNNPSKITDSFAFTITFQCFSYLPGTLDWKIVYIGSPNNCESDQIIDSFDMENLAPGVMQFSVDSDCPNFNLLSNQEIIGTTAIIISAMYKRQEFFRCGYYVRNEYNVSILQPPKNVSLPDLNRFILSENPRIFRFEIEWGQSQRNLSLESQLLETNLQIMKEKQIEQNNCSVQGSSNLRYSYGMFPNGQTSL